MTNKNIEIRDIRSGNFLWMEKVAFKYISHNAGPSGAVVYAWLCYYANNSSQNAWPSIQTIQDDSSLGRMTIVRALKKLQEIRAIDIQKDPGAHNVYTLLEIQEELFSEPVSKRDQYQNGTSTKSGGGTSTTRRLPINEQHNINNIKRGARKKFVKPSLEEVKSYVRERGNKIDAEVFYDHYEANGWVQGNRGKPVVEWKACVRTWEKRESGYKNGKEAASKAGSPCQKFPGADETDKYLKSLKE